MKPQGRHGEVAVELFTSFPERFAERRSILALEANGSRRPLEVEEFWSHKGRMILKFAGVDSIDEAERLVGCEIQVPLSQRSTLEPDEAYVSDLVGCAVFVVEAGQEARQIGTIADVTFGAGEAPLLVIRSGRREHLVPFAQAYIARLDLAGKRIEMRLPEGMLELDAPLSADEKREQQQKH